MLDTVLSDDSDADIKNFCNDLSDCDNETMYIPSVYGVVPHKFRRALF